MTNCLVCQRLELARQGKNPYLVTEFKHSYLVVGDHQYHRGYCVLLFKEHVSELHELAPAFQHALLDELMTAAHAMSATFNPWRLNYACYGNAQAHVHWHIFPRYEEDADHKRNPWLHADEFKEHAIGEVEAMQLAGRIRLNLALVK